MSRDYSRVAPQFWTGSTGRAIRSLGAECQMLALYLLTSPHSTATGLYSLPLAYVSADTGMTIEGASKALLSLREVGFCDYDEAAEVIWVPEMARFQIAEALKDKDKRGPWVVATASKFRKHRFFRRFVLKYREAFCLRIGDDELPDDTDAQSPIEGPSKPLRCQEQEQEQELEQEREQEHAPSAPLSLASRPVDAMLRSLAPDEREAQTVQAISEGRVAAGGRPFKPAGYRDRDAVKLLGEWAAGQPEGTLRLAAEGFFRNHKQKCGASVSWLADEDPGRWIATTTEAPAKPPSSLTKAAEVEARLTEAIATAERLLGTDVEREAEAQRIVARLREELRQARAA